MALHFGVRRSTVTTGTGTGTVHAYTCAVAPYRYILYRTPRRNPRMDGTATRFKSLHVLSYWCKTGELNTAICSGSSDVVLCSRQQALERCKSKYSVVCSSLNTPVWPAGRRFVTLARNLAGWRRGLRWPQAGLFPHIVPAGLSVELNRRRA